MLVLGWFALTLGWVAVTGALPAMIAPLAPVGSAMTAGLILFVLGTALIALAVYALGALTLMMARRRAG